MFVQTMVRLVEGLGSSTPECAEEPAHSGQEGESGIGFGADEEGKGRYVFVSCTTNPEFLRRAQSRKKRS